MPRKAKGGYREPSKPAAVSGPGALSQRTDGGPGQPVRPAPAQSYGDRAASVAQQTAAPMRAGGATSPSATVTPEQGAPPPGMNVDPFRPTERPGEPTTAGVPLGAGPAGAAELDSMAAVVRALYRQFPNDDLLDVIAEMEERGA